MLIKNDVEKVTNAKDVYGFLWDILQAEPELEQAKEHFWVIGLNQNNTVKFIDLCHLGGMTASLVDPRNIFKLALSQGVSHILIAHNHISGNFKPSEADKKVTDKLVKGGKVLDIEVIDSVIISSEGYYSFAEHNLI